MQSISYRPNISLLLLVPIFVMNAWGQCSPPIPPLAPFQCNGCNEIQVFYCEQEPNPGSLADFLRQNPTYLAGADFIWYADKNGIKDTLIPTEPSVDTSSPDSLFFWVSQSLNRCESSSIRLRIEVRRTPDLQVMDTIGFCYPSQMDIAGQVVDLNRVSNAFQYFHADPALGTAAFQTFTASNGVLSPANQHIWVAPPNPTTYWVVGSQGGNWGPVCADTVNFTISPFPVPQLPPSPPLYACEGSYVSLPFVQTNVPSYLIFWTNDNLDIGLPATGMGNPPTFQAPEGMTEPDTAHIVFYVLSGPCFGLDTLELIIQPKPLISTGPGDTICSRDNINVQLSTRNQLPGPISYQWNAPLLASGLQSNASGGTGNIIQATFTNTGASERLAQYEVIATSAIGCTSTPDTIDIVVKPEPVISSGLDKDICSSQPAQLAFSTQNTLPQVNYQWTSGPLPAGLSGINGSPSSGTGPQLQDAFLNTGNTALSVSYQLQAEADGCIAIPQQVELTIQAIQHAGPLQLLSCEDRPGSGQASFNLTDVNLQISGNPATAFYSDRELTQQILSPQAFVSSGQSIYAVRQGNMPCPESWEISLQVKALPSSPLPAVDRICQGTVFTLAPQNGSSFNFYSGNPATGNPQLLGKQLVSLDTLLLIPNSTVDIWVSSWDGFCESPASLHSIEIKPIPHIFHLSSNDPLCEGDDLHVVPSTSKVLSFEWTSTDPAFISRDSVLSIENISLSQTGTYYLTIQNTEGCQFVDSTEIQVVLPPYGGQDTLVNFCHGDPSFNLFDALGPGASSNGFWVGPSQVPGGYLGTFVPGSMSFGIYTYNLTGHVCQAPQYVRVEVKYFPIPSPRLSATMPLFEGDDLTLLANDGVSYQWTGPNGFSASGVQVTRPQVTLADAGHYNVEVTNEGGCVGNASISVRIHAIPRTTVDLAVWLEGPYDPGTGLMWDSIRTLGSIPLTEPYSAMNFNFVGGGGETIDPSVLQVTGPNAIVDWIFVDLRDPNDSLVTLASRACLLQRDGDIVDLDGVSDPVFTFLPDGFYYVVLDHRNHLSIMTEMPIYLETANPTTIDFRDANIPLFGFNPSKVIGNQNFMYSGDANGDDQVQVIDLVGFWVPNVGGSGYLKADWNMDGQVQNIDFINFWVPNAGRGSQVPGKAL